MICFKKKGFRHRLVECHVGTLNSLKDEQDLSLRSVLDRVVVIDNELAWAINQYAVGGTSGFIYGWVPQILPSSVARLVLNPEFIEVTRENGYHSQVLDLNLGILHEMGHQTGWLPDIYPFDDPGGQKIEIQKTNGQNISILTPSLYIPVVF